MASALISGEEIKGALSSLKPGLEVPRAASPAVEIDSKKRVSTNRRQSRELVSDGRSGRTCYRAPGKRVFDEVGMNHPSEFVSELNLEKHCWTSQQWHLAGSSLGGFVRPLLRRGWWGRFGYRVQWPREFAKPHVSTRSLCGFGTKRKPGIRDLFATGNRLDRGSSCSKTGS